MKREVQPGEVDKLKLEQLRGSQAEHAYMDFIQPFIQEKKAVLFEAFEALPLTAKEDLMEVKRMTYAINALDDEIRSIINTGKMASKLLSESENEVQH